MTTIRETHKNCWYHVMNRGHSKRHIFLNDHQRYYFLKLLETASDKYKIDIHAYCLMRNHYHLLVYTQKNNLSNAIQFINMHHAKNFNSQRKRDGAVFRGRFKSIAIYDDLYRINVCRYIHLNPVEAGLVKRSEDYQWSSSQNYVGIKKNDWLQTAYLLELEPNHSMYLQKGLPRKIKEIYGKEKWVSSLGTQEKKE